LAAFRQAIRPRSLEDFSVNATPPTRLAISDRVLFFREPLTAFLPANDVGHLDHRAVHAAPTVSWAAGFLCFVLRVVALPALCFAVGSRRLDYFSINAAPAAPTISDRFFW
jgi:hypothetical protein